MKLNLISSVLICLETSHCDTTYCFLRFCFLVSASLYGWDRFTLSPSVGMGHGTLGYGVYLAKSLFYGSLIIVFVPWLSREEKGDSSSRRIALWLPWLVFVAPNEYGLLIPAVLLLRPWWVQILVRLLLSIRSLHFCRMSDQGRRWSDLLFVSHERSSLRFALETANLLVCKQLNSRWLENLCQSIIVRLARLPERPLSPKEMCLLQNTALDESLLHWLLTLKVP